MSHKSAPFTAVGTIAIDLGKGHGDHPVTACYHLSIDMTSRRSWREGCQPGGQKMRRRHKEVKALRRRDVLIGAGSLAAGGTLSFPAPAIAQGTRQLKMVTDWPAGSPGLNPSAARLAQRIATASAGRINIEVFPSGTLHRGCHCGRIRSLTCGV